MRELKLVYYYRYAYLLMRAAYLIKPSGEGDDRLLEASERLCSYADKLYSSYEGWDNEIEQDIAYHRKKLLEHYKNGNVDKVAEHVAEIGLWFGDWEYMAILKEEEDIENQL